MVVSLESWKRLNNKDVILVPSFMTSEKAWTKLTWLLRMKKLNLDKIKALMRVSINREVIKNPDEGTEEYLKLRGSFYNFIGKETYRNNYQEGRCVVNAFPGINWKIYEDAVNRLLNDTVPIQKKTLYVIGFGDGNLPVGNNDIFSRVEEKYLID